MNQISIGQSTTKASEIALGCMRLHQLSVKEGAELIQTALEEGIDFFDHADIYGGGTSEERFAQVLSQEKIDRSKLFIQTKCGICKGYFDFSKEHILSSVDASLKRLGTDWVDFLLLHRPDSLMEPEEVAEAFGILRASGKVRHFGVSNQKPMQIALLQKYLDEPLMVNQLQFGLAHSQIVSNGLHVNMLTEEAVERDGSVLEYCRLHDITIQPWSPFQHGFFGGVFLEHPEYLELNQVLSQLASKYQVSKTTIATAWILRHPAQMQPVVGTLNSERLKEICAASPIRLTRPEWYALYKAAGHILP